MDDNLYKHYTLVELVTMNYIHQLFENDFWSTHIQVQKQNPLYTKIFKKEVSLVLQGAKYHTKNG